MWTRGEAAGCPFFLKETYPTPVAAQLHFQRMDHLSIYGTDDTEQVPARSTTLQASSIKNRVATSRGSGSATFCVRQASQQDQSQTKPF